MEKFAEMSTGRAVTPVLNCRDYAGIVVAPTPVNSSPNAAGGDAAESMVHPLDRPTYTIPASISAHVNTAAGHLLAGRCVAIPTETVYGLAASSLDPEACRLIYRIKNRPSDNPLIMHVSSLDMLRRLLPPRSMYTPSKLYMALISAFWPGPLTLLFPSPDPPALPAPQTNGIRMPSHPLALAVIHTADTPVSAPSANSSGRPSPTRAEHVVHDIGGSDGLGCVMDGGDCGVGVESTVVDGLAWKEEGGGEVNVLRPGGLGVEAIARVLREVDGREGRTRVLVHGKPWKPTGARAAKLEGSQGVSVKDDAATPTTTRTITPTTTTTRTDTDTDTTDTTRTTTPPLSRLPTDAALFPSTPGMKYRHYSPRIPVYLALPSTTFPSPSLAVGTCTTTPNQLLRLLGSAHTPQIPDRPLRIGVLHYVDSPLSIALQRSAASVASAQDSEVGKIALTYRSLGANATSAAQVLFSSMLDMERQRPLSTHADGVIYSLLPAVNGDAQGGGEDGDGVDVIVIEGCTDEGLGLAVMERVRKAVGGGGILGDVKDGQGSREQGVFWVDLGSA